jgi:hypothetical protein
LRVFTPAGTTNDNCRSPPLSCAKKRTIFLAISSLCGGLLSTLSSNSSAAIVETSGSLVKVPVPISVYLGANVSNKNIITFDEVRNFKLPKAIAVDITAPGTYSSEQMLSPGTIAAGTVVNSHFVHFDPEGRSTTFVTLSGSLTVDGDILGVIISTIGLDSTDKMLGASHTRYHAGGVRGLELGLGVNDDRVIVHADRRKITVHWSASIVTDEIRIITAPPNAQKH